MNRLIQWAPSRSLVTCEKMAKVVCDVEVWLRKIDASLVKYLDDFIDLDFTNTNTLKFFVPDDFLRFKTQVSEVHRRMIVNGIAKLQTPMSKAGLDQLEPGPRSNNLKPKQLFSDEHDDNIEDVEFTYKSPAEMMIADSEEKIEILRVEYESAKEFADSLKKRYVNSDVFIDKTKAQCGKCHIRDGHNKSKCINGPCPGPESCNDVEKHPPEKKLLNDALTTSRAKEKELEGMKSQLAAKKNALSETRCSFRYRVETVLINTNLEKYTFITAQGRAARQTVINNDMHILEKHFGGRVPVNLHEESKKFQTIIEKFNKDHILSKTKKTVNPEVRLLEMHGIRFPEFSASRYTAGTSGSSGPWKKRFRID